MSGKLSSNERKTLYSAPYCSSVRSLWLRNADGDLLKTCPITAFPGCEKCDALSVGGAVEVCEIAGARRAGVVRTGPLLASHRSHGFDQFALGREFGEFRFPVGKFAQRGGQGSELKPILEGCR